MKAALFIIAAIAIYGFLIRPIMRQRAELEAFFTASEMARAGWWAKLKLGWAGLRTKLLARFLMGAGLLVPLLSILADADLSSMLPTINVTSTWQITPAQYWPMIVVPLIGWATNYLRNVTTTPVGVPSEEQVAAVIPMAAPAVIAQKTAEIAESKAPPAATQGKD